MKKLSALGALLVVVLAGCGGGHHQSQTHQRGYLTPYGPSAHSLSFGLPTKGDRAIFGDQSASPSVQTVEMFDSVTVSTVPSNPPAVAGYVSGSWPTYSALVQDFPHAWHISIATWAGASAQCLDVEPGDAVPAQVATWVRWMLSLHVWRPCLYANLSEMDSGVLPALANAGIARSTVRLWDADWTFFPHLDAGFDATQWTDHSLARNLDESTVALCSFLGSCPSPGPTQDQLNAWQRARDASLRAYKRDHCSRPALGPDVCVSLGRRVGYFQQQLNPWRGRPHCFGPHRQLSAPVCQIVRPRVYIRSQAVALTSRAESREGCKTAAQPEWNPTCRQLARRAAFFQLLINIDLY